MKSAVGMATCVCLLLIAEHTAAHQVAMHCREKRLDILERKFKDQEMKLKMATHVESGSYMSGSTYGKSKTNTIINHIVTFKKAYSTAPHIVLSLDYLDANEEHNLRYDLTAVQVTGSGFVISMKTWSTTHIYKARVSWVAIPKLHHAN